MGDPRTREASHALHHVFRRQILRCLEEGREACSPEEVGRQMGQPLSKVSYHFRVLRGCEAVAQTHQRTVGGTAQHFFVSQVPGSPLAEELLRATEAEDEEELPRNLDER
ncbi:MAG: helix-turn-helix domain-containing protein [Solirubrobacterales bacterium]